MTMKFLKFFFIVSMTVVGLVGTSSCDCHHFDEPDPGMSVGDILCTDGSVIPFKEYVGSTKEAVAIVYYVNPDIDDEIRGYAVYLGDIKDAAFSDEASISQGTSCDIEALDGNENTYALYRCEQAGSPMADPVFDMWTYGQSAYIPSVAQLRQLQLVKDFLNPRIEAMGGDYLPDNPDECWYWSSTEVDGQAEEKAWLVSMNSGIIHESPKTQEHHVRPFVTIYRNNSHDSSTSEDDVLATFRTQLNLSIDVNNKMFDYKDIDSTRLLTKGSLNWGLRYCVAAYRRDETTPYDVQTSYDGSVTFNLPAGKYNFVGWADHVPEYNGKSHYFHTDDFSEILLRHKYDYEGCDEGKLAYREKKEIRVGVTTNAGHISLTPSVARYRLIATDTANFTPGKVLIYYYDLPAAVNGHSGKVNYRWNDVSFESSVNGNVLAFDNVLAEEEEITTKVCVEIYDERNNLRARVRSVEIPLIKGGITTVRGNFYSILDLDNDMAQGGIVIDPDFEENVEIEF